MTRKEEIFKASADTFNEYGYELTKTIKMFWLSAFIAGAEWADNNPTEGIVNLNDIWHDIKEEPENGSHILMRHNYEGDKEFKSFHIKYDEYVNWQKLIKIYGISQWAYISDLLPKGGVK